MAKSKNTTILISTSSLVAAVAGICIWTPFDYVLEAGSASYYQARLAYLRGSDADQHAIRTIFSDHKITMHEYSNVVFPTYLKSVNAPENPFPIGEQRKSKVQLRAELDAVLE